MMKVLVVEDEEMIRKGIVLAVDWAALDCVVVGEASNRRKRDCRPLSATPPPSLSPI